MIKHEFSRHRYHYTLLIIVEAIILSLFINTHDQLMQIFLAITVGAFYFLWGVITHAGSYRPMRLMLEYAVIGLFASVMLIVLVKSV